MLYCPVCKRNTNHSEPEPGLYCCLSCVHEHPFIPKPEVNNDVPDGKMAATGERDDD